MQNSKSIEPVWAYALLGALLGVLPPAVFFMMPALIYPAATPPEPNVPDISRIFILITAICLFVGTGSGAGIGLIMMIIRQKSWALPVALSPFLGLGWAVLTGGAGGFPMFVIGALFGIIYAVPFGAAGFLIFSGIYEPLMRRRRLRWGQTALAAAGVPIFLTLAAYLSLLALGR